MREPISPVPLLCRGYGLLSPRWKKLGRVFQEAQVLLLLLGRGYLPGGVLALHPLLPLSPPLREEQG